MKLQNFVGTGLKYSFQAIAADKELTTQIQIRLITLGLLELPSDGNFGPITTAALKKFQNIMKCEELEYLGAVTAKRLIEAKLEDIPPQPLKLGNNLASRIIKYMQAMKYQISQGPRQYNIVYIEGMDANGNINSDAPNYFNDRRIVLQILDGAPAIIGNWEATTEPGYHYTYNPMSEKGAARIKFGQYKAWQVGLHGNYDTHEALEQVAPITVHRDFNQDLMRTGDKLDTGLFAINQHWGYDLPYNNIDMASAGCLVGRTRQGHREFMKLLKQDLRYQLNNDYTFYTTVMPGDDLVKRFPSLE